MKSRVVLASTNKGKLKEFREILSDFNVVLCSDLGFKSEIEETGDTFYENALIKAKAVYNQLKVPVLADDSGLMVEALFGAPGIYSARYAKTGKDKDNINLLLKNLKDEKNRKAKFVSTVVFYAGEDKIYFAMGETEGEILYAPKGENGFGYDPIFFSSDLKKSMGESSPEEKNSVSHRARALEKLKKILKENL